LVSIQTHVPIELDVTKKTIEKVALDQATAPLHEEPMPPPPVPAPAITPSTPRAVIKLKVGGAQPKGGEPSTATPPPVAIPTLKVKKPKVAVDLPPPPYVDDGSHDLLQEVIAIENARTDKSQPSSSVKLTFGKRKRDASATDDDNNVVETTVKKERSSASFPPGEVPKPKPKLVIAPVRRKPVDAALEDPVVAPRTDTATPTRKGKEREIPSLRRAETPKSTPESRPALVSQAGTPSQGGTPINDRKCKDILKILMRLPEAAIFLRPVDPVLDGCPT
jgi:transcription initiation factor TFIID subunit 2